MTDATAQPQDAIKNLYLFFSRLFLNEVDAPILERIRSGELRAPLEEAGMDIKFLEGAAPTVLDDLAVEYSALFIQPGSLPPFQSVVRGGRYLTEDADKVELFYQKYGFDYRTQYPKLFPDHLGLELWFVASLIEAEQKAKAAGRADEEGVYAAARTEFLKTHMAEWAPKYFETLARMTKHPFYRPMIEFAAAFLDSEIERANA